LRTQHNSEDDIRTEIIMARGFIQKSRKVDFGVASGDAIVDENEDEYDLDELDAFADTTDEIITEMGLKTEFLEAERRRKHLCGSDVGEEDAVQNQESEFVEHEIVDLVSEDELNNWDVDESNVVVLKQNDSHIPSLTSNFRWPSTPEAESETLRRSPRKRNRVSCDSNDLPCLDQIPTVYKVPGELKYIVRRMFLKTYSSRHYR
jgi:hypothetical protein